jgi:transcriptional regulator with XRE-family HTH domain
VGEPWNEVLRSERLRLGLTQAELASRAALDAETIRKYEKGTRQPSREALARILDALQASTSTAHRVMIDRGFYHPDSRFSQDGDGGYYFMEADLRPFIDRAAWPIFVGNEHGELIAANVVARTLWNVDLEEEARRRGSTRISLFVAIADPRIAGRLVNRDEMLREFIAIFKSAPASRSMLDAPGPRFSGMLDLVGATSPRFLLSLLRLWAGTPPHADRVRWTYPVIWQEPGYPEMRLVGTVNPASEPEGWAFNDWIPADAASFATLEEILHDRGAQQPKADAGNGNGRRSRP